MRELLHSELIKLRTTRTFYALAGVSIGLALVFVTLSALLTDEPTKESALQDIFLSDPSSFFILILAIVGITGEWRHRTITSSLLAAPLRVRFLLAKMLAFASAGVLLSLAISVVIGVVGLTILSIRDEATPDLADLIVQFLRNAGVAAILGALGVCVGALIRNQPTAIVFVLVLGFVIDPLLGALAPEVEKFSPFGAVINSIQGISPENAGMPDVDYLDVPVALVMEAVWGLALFAAAAYLLRTRDVD